MLAELTDRQWLWCSAGFYLAGFAAGTVSLTRGKRPASGSMYGLIAIGYLLQVIGLNERGRIVGECPLGNTFEIVQFIAWSMTSLYLVVGVTFRTSFLGYFTSALAAALTLASLAVPAWDPPRSVFFGGNPWIELHAALAVFSYGVFALLALTSLLFLLRHYSLKSKRLGGWFTFLPSIFELDHIGVRLLSAGVVLLGASVAVGSVYLLKNPAAAATPADHVVTAAIWVAYAAALWLRLGGRLLANRFAWICLALFSAALISLGAVESGRHLTPPVVRPVAAALQPPVP